MAEHTWSGEAYAQTSGHHRRFDDWFLDRHPPQPTDVVVDLGCGSGEFSARLASLVPDGQVVGVEPDPSMLEQARRHAGDNLRFVQAGAQDVDTAVPASSADLVVSRAMLHWLPLSAYPRCFTAVWRVLRPGGWFHSESGGAGNVPAVARRLAQVAAAFDVDPPAPFPDAGVVFDLVEAAGFEVPDDGVRTTAQRRPFSREELTAFLRAQAAVAVTRNAPADRREAIADAVAADVDELRRHDGSYDQTFVRLEILARRPT